jgi:hypothetical protein
MIIQLINMNIGLREYPVKVRCYHSLWVTSISVAVLIRCRQMFAVKSRCRRSSRSLVVDVEEVVVRERVVAWRRSAKTLSPAYPEQDLSSRTRFRRLCSRRYRARGADDGDAKRKQQNGGRERGLLNRNTPHAHGSARRASERVCTCARLSPLFNFTRGVPKGYRISWMGDSFNTHTLFLFFS